MDNRIIDFLTGLEKHKTADGVFDATCDFFHAEGFNLVSHGYLDGGGENAEHKKMRIVGPGSLKQFYFEHGHKYDPMRFKTSVGLDPFLTGPDFADRERDGDVYINGMNQVREFGISCGFAIPLRATDTGDTGRFLTASELPGKDLAALYGEKRKIYQLAVLLADQRLRALPAQWQLDKIGLSPRERECLLWLAKGLRTDRISDRLGIASSTVNLHFTNARRKLGAATREQALAIAVHLGIIEP